jgi:hypothetical protein
VKGRPKRPKPKKKAPPPRQVTVPYAPPAADQELVSFSLDLLLADLERAGSREQGAGS